MSVSSREWGKTTDGRVITEYTIENASGMKAGILDFGAVLRTLVVPDRDKKPVDVVLGYDDPEKYLTNGSCFGATVGRHANRIAGACFTLNGKEYRLAANDGRNNLHSNPGSYYFRMWEAKPVGDDSVEFFLCSPDGDQGYPGNLLVKVTYRLTDDNGLRITYDLKSDADTLANMTNHSYFNLSGHDSGNVLSQRIRIDADYVTASDAELIPTGEIRSVEGTPFDFRTAKEVGRDMDLSDEQIRNGGGYDHNFVLREGDGVRLVGRMESDATGIAMDVYTDMPGMQLYTACATDEPHGKGGCHYKKYCGACFETQFFPDSIHHDNFRSCILKAGEEFVSVTEYRFGTI